MSLLCILGDFGTGENINYYTSLLAKSIPKSDKFFIADVSHVKNNNMNQLQTKIKKSTSEKDLVKTIIIGVHGDYNNETNIAELSITENYHQCIDFKKFILFLMKEFPNVDVFHLSSCHGGKILQHFKTMIHEMFDQQEQIDGISRYFTAFNHTSFELLVTYDLHFIRLNSLGHHIFDHSDEQLNIGNFYVVHKNHVTITQQIKKKKRKQYPSDKTSDNCYICNKSLLKKNMSRHIQNCKKNCK